MIELSVIRDLVAIFGVIAGFSYYVLTVRNARRGQRAADEARQLESVMRMSSMIDFGSAKAFIELLNMEWDDYDDFERKYGSDNNPENYAKRLTTWQGIDAIGLAFRRELIDRELYLEQSPYWPVVLWAKFGDVIREIRRRYNQPLSLRHFEYLAEECRRYIQDKGLDASVPDTFFSYVPER